MSDVCPNHRTNPIKIYDQCVACEIETMRENAKEREEHIQKLTNDLFEIRERYSKQNYDYYNDVRISMDEKESMFRERKLLLEKIAEKDREIEWLRQERESLEGRLAMHKGYDA